jgi:hypothetical protein
MSLVPPALKSPIVIVLGLVLLAIVLWGSWIFLRRPGSNHQVRNNPASITEEADDTTLRDVSRI